jgi:hypothetical protein
MSSVVISGDTSGAITLAAPTVAGANTITLPAVTGNAVVASSAVSATGQIPFSTDGSTYTPTAKIVQGTAQASTSGTSIDFTGIPSWVKRITVMLQGVSTNGTSVVQVQLGTGGTPTYTTSGYSSNAIYNGGALTSTNGMLMGGIGASDARNGACQIVYMGSNNWVSSSVICVGTNGFAGGGGVSLAAALTAVRITTVNGTDTFDAGSINILYE